MTTKLILVVIGLTSVGAILVPTYAVPTIKSADIFDETIQSVDIKNGEVKTVDLAPGAVVPNVQTVKGPGTELSPQETDDDTAVCPSGYTVIGGGFAADFGTEVRVSSPIGSNTWQAGGTNISDQPVIIFAYARCMGPSP